MAITNINLRKHNRTHKKNVALIILLKFIICTIGGDRSSTTDNLKINIFNTLHGIIFINLISCKYYRDLSNINPNNRT